MLRFSADRSADADRIVAAAIAAIAEHGFRALTLRDLAQSVGRSTTVIVNLFGSKGGLLEAVAEAGYIQDLDFHQTFFRAVKGLPAGRDGLLSVILQYLRLRADTQAGFVRVWEGLLLDVEGGETRRTLMVRWENMRQDAWREHLSSNSALAELAPVLSHCLTIEQFYAGALLGRPDYAAICGEGFGALIDHVLGRTEEPATTTLWYRSQLAVPRAPTDDLPAGSMQLKLLDIAADQILTHGVGAVTNRSVSNVAGTSTSTIAYHWPDMRHFLIDAVWHCVFREIPRYPRPRSLSPHGAPEDLKSWAELMAPTLAAPIEANAGFYIRYARLIATVCLEARRDAQFQDLAMLLRGPEGGGTYNHREGVWPASYDLTRLAATRFALWIKGRALAAGAAGAVPATAELEHAAQILVARRD